MEGKIEIKQVSEREFWMNENRLFLANDKILYAMLVGDVDNKTAIEGVNICNKLVNMVEGKVNLLIDLNKAGKLSLDARKRFKEFGEQAKTGKVAHFGMHPVAQIIATFVMGLSKNKNMRFFKTKDEALAWLME